MNDDLQQIDSSKVLEAIYGQDVRLMREEVLGYLRLKGVVFFLFDNLDRFWTPGGFTDDDALIVIGLAESMQEIARKFSRHKLDFSWAIFVRSDVYEFLVRGMADYGKLAVQSLEWTDRALMKTLFEDRLRSSASHITGDWSTIWSRASVATVKGRPVLDFLIDGSLMRPRYLIRLFESSPPPSTGRSSSIHNALRSPDRRPPVPYPACGRVPSFSLLPPSAPPD